MEIGRVLSSLGEVKKGVPLKRFTSFKIGGEAEAFFSPYSEETFLKAVKVIKEKNIPFYILGRGSNILVSSKGVKGVVIKPEFSELSLQDRDGDVYAGAMVPVGRLLNFCLDNSLSGAEFLSGIPGSIGGVLVNNASFQKKSISKLARTIKVLDAEKEAISYLSAEDIFWNYRKSSLRGKVVLGAVLSLRKENEKEIKNKIRDNINFRLKKQNLECYSAGCVFRNPEGAAPAGQLIDEAGLKGCRKGRAVVSFKHANFIINESCANSEDVISLIEYIKEKVKDKFGVILEEEIQRWGC